MNELCECGGTTANTGRPDCDSIFLIASTFILVKKNGDDGLRNRINLADVLSQAYFTAKVNHIDASKRWYPIHGFKNVTSEKAESIFEEFDDRSKLLISDGIRSGTGIIPKTSPNFLEKLNEWKCSDFGMFVIDIEGKLRGSKEDDGFLYPIEVDNDSWNPQLVFSTNTTFEKILLSFDFSVDQKDEDLRMLILSDLAAGVKLLSLRALLDLNPAISGISTVGFTALLKTDFGSIKNPILAKGLVTADFSLVEISPIPGAVAITSVTETNGSYAFAIPLQGIGDVLRLTISKNGYAITTVDFTIL